MKKIIAILLSVLCFCSVVALPVSASDFETTKVTNIFGEEEEPTYQLHYEKETAANISMMYRPNPSVSLEEPAFVIVTKDTPIAVDHDFICWRDLDGKLYYPGDKIFVDGDITLYAVWEEKKDNTPRVIRIIQAALLTMQRAVLKLLGVFETARDFVYTTTSAEA